MRTAIKVTRKNRKSIFAHGIYELKYEKGSIVKAPVDSLGCMCFETLPDAEKFVTRGSFQHILYLKVTGLGEESFPRILSFYSSEKTLRMFYTSKLRLLRSPPTGTVCYPEVLVLD